MQQKMAPVGSNGGEVTAASAPLRTAGRRSIVARDPDRSILPSYQLVLSPPPTTNRSGGARVFAGLLLLVVIAASTQPWYFLPGEGRFIGIRAISGSAWVVAALLIVGVLAAVAVAWPYRFTSFTAGLGGVVGAGLLLLVKVPTSRMYTNVLGLGRPVIGTGNRAFAFWAMLVLGVTLALHSLLAGRASRPHPRVVRTPPVASAGSPG